MKPNGVTSKIVGIALVCLMLGTMLGGLASIGNAIVNTSDVYASSLYNRQAAYDYAQYYCNKVCSDGYFFNDAAVAESRTPGSPVPAGGQDCAHFVSCCIGGPGGGVFLPSRYGGGVYGEPGAKRLGDWLLADGQGIAEPKSSMSELEKGDVIIYQVPGVGYHAVFYCGNSKVAAHSASICCGTPASYPVYRYIHIAKSQKFDVGDTVQTTTCLNVRINPKCNADEISHPKYQDCAPAGSTGVIIDGPESYDTIPPCSEVYVWWKVRFESPDTGYTGWCAQNWLEKVTACPHSCWDRNALPGNELAALVRNHFPLGGVTQTGESIRVTAYAIAKAESGGNPSACGDNDKSIGLWQINIDYHPEYDKCHLFEEDYNANAAKEVSNNGKGWNPWCTWEQTACGGNGDESYKNYLLEARRHFYPKVTSLSVSQTSINLGEAAKIYYSVSDDVGLDRVELWRAIDVNGDGQPDWPQDPQSEKPASGQSASDYFEDTPSSPDTYWYGIHVIDNSGAPEAWNDERNSRTGGLPGIFGPIEVEVISPNQPPQLSNGHVDPPSGDTSTNFHYYVTYFDPDGDSPSVKQVFIDGTAYTMSEYLYEDSRIIYRYGPKNLSAGGTHYYFFYFEDGGGGATRLPSGTDMYLGPSFTLQTYPPEVTTNAASSITTSSATLNANLDSTGGLSCQVWFEWWWVDETGLHERETPHQSMSSVGLFNAEISDLSAGQIYNFRACVSNSEGINYGLEDSFTTLAPEICIPSEPLDFGDVNVGDHEARQLDIYNLGTATLTINSITRTSGSSEFSPLYGYAPFDIEAGSYGATLIFFDPSSEGQKNATFTINSNDPYQPSVTFDVLGNGIVAPNQPPNQPSNVSPTSGTTVTLTPTFQSSAFSDPDVGDTHAASQWQITATSGDYSSPIFDSNRDASNLTSITIPSGILNCSTTYYWHVRHQDNHGDWSSYSSETSFTTQSGPGLKTWCVDDDLQDYPDADFTKIQDAVDAASPGDDIIVYPGTYTENVDVNTHHLTIQSENGAETTIVQAATSSDPVFYVTADWVNITGFTVQNATDGISLDYANHCTVSDNNVTNNTYGIELFHSSSNTITNNTASNNIWSGIYLRSSSSNTITSNTASNNTDDGIQMSYSSSNTLTNNTMVNDGIHLYGYSVEHWNTHTIDTSNKVNGKPVYYWKDTTGGVVPAGAGQVILANCAQVTVENQNISKVTTAIELGFCNDNTITNNTVWNNTDDGIALYYSSSNIITNNNASNNDRGIYLYFSNNNNIITNNTASNNNYYGIHLYSSNNNTLTNNTISNNNYDGINLYYSTNNTIYLNSFIDNTAGNVYSSSSTNNWNSPEEITYTYKGSTYTNYLGNYWDDYAEKYPDADEVDSTGIWDTAYSIDGDSDNYPLMEPFENYEIGPPLYDFSLSVDPASGTMPQSGSITATVSVALISGLAQPVSLSATGLPGAMILFSPDTGNPPYSSEMWISTELTAPPGLPSPGTYLITITGSSAEVTKTTTFTLTVLVPNEPPVADAGSDQSVSSSDLVYFDGSNSYDPDGNVVTYGWEFGDGEAGTGCHASHRFRGAMNESKTYTVTLTVEDNSGATATDSCDITVTPLEKIVEVTHELAIPVPGQPVFARMTVSYNWIHDDTYVVSRIHYESGGFIGVGAISIWDFHSHEVPVPKWAADIFSFRGEREEIYSPILEEIHYGGDIFQGIEVDAYDAMNVYIAGWAGISISIGPSLPAPFFETNSACFQPDYAEAPDVPIEALSFNLARLCSPGELRVYDPEGRVTGLVNGEVKEEIPYSAYNNNTVIILSLSDSYRYEVVGTDEGSYGLGIASIEDGETAAFATTEVPITTGAKYEYTIDWAALSEGEKGVTIRVDSDGDGEFEETILTTPPNTPSNPSPANHTAGVSVNAALSWVGGDPDEEDSVTYKVYFGTSTTPPLVSNDQSATTYDPGTLAYNTKYYWKIVAIDNHGVVTEGPLWDFTTVLVATYDIHLVSGWNLISLPLIPENHQIDVITSSLGTNLKKVYYYNSDIGGYLIYNPQMPFPTGSDLHTMEEGKGYWFLVDNPCTFTIQGTRPSYPYTIFLSGGWNSIGLPLIPENQQINEITSSLGTNLKKVYYYDSDIGGYLIYNPQMPFPAGSDLHTMEEGKGYWFLVDNPCTFTIESPQ